MAELNYLPASAADVDDTAFSNVKLPGHTYKLDIERGCIRGFTDKADAVLQAVYLALSIERYKYSIYSRNYGVELNDLIGKPRDYAMSEIERRITGALLVDDRIKSVDGWNFETLNSAVRVAFTVHTIYGDIETTKEVDV